MKKILYGIIVLLGIGFISTNFIIDTNTVDHKTVKAGGTACKWISDTGYGTGPIYYSCDNTTENFLYECVSIFKCDSSLEGEVLKSGVIYNDDRTLLNGKRSTRKKANNNTDDYTFENGIVTVYQPWSTGNGTKEYPNSKYVLVPSYAFKDANAYTDVIGSSSSTRTLHSDLLPSQYTCVCAEY